MMHILEFGHFLVEKKEIYVRSVISLVFDLFLDRTNRAPRETSNKSPPIPTPTPRPILATIKSPALPLVVESGAKLADVNEAETQWVLEEPP